MSKIALQRACEICGGQSHLAEAIGVTQSMVWYWLARAKKGVPAEYAVKIATATKGAVPASDLRPDVFAPLEPKPETVTAEQVPA